MLVVCALTTLHGISKAAKGTELYRVSRNTWRMGLLPPAFLLAASFALIFQLVACGSIEGDRDVIRRGHLSFEKLVRVHPELISVANIFDETSLGPQVPDERLQQLALFAKVFGLAQREYVEILLPERLITGALNGIKTAQITELEPDVNYLRNMMTVVLQHMISDLDAHSDYLTPADYEQIQVRTRGEFGGIGLEMTMEHGLVKCITSIEDTPAQRAGIRPGDLISHINGEPVLGMTLIQAVKKMRGSAGSAIVVTVRRGTSSEAFDVRLVREIIRIKPVSARAEGDIGYIRIVTFNERTYRSMNRAIAGLSRELGGRMNGLVIDLRDNPGGLFDQALQVSDAFLVEGEIVSTVGRHRDRVRRFRADPEDLASGIPIAVLINGGSASASEIVSGALKDHGRVVVFGQRSFGKGSVQTVIPLGQGQGALRLTTARYYTPSGQSIQVHGIEPDIISVEADPAQREKNLRNPLSAEGQVRKGNGALMEEVCPDVSGGEDPILLCALHMLRSGLLSVEIQTLN
ncbi:MAG TPA: S41 family peptidase [Alphaproteobacteria bacterium]|nr:S41 family peptidase [Alphaproteobacteria bacterium]